MTLKDIQNYGGNTRRAVTQIVLDASDTVEMLNEADKRYESFIDIYDLLGTEYEDFVPAFISVQNGESWGMRGQIFTFSLTEKLKAHILKAGIDGTCYGWWNNKRPLFENFTFYKGDKLIFTCCTHEVEIFPNLSEINDELAPEILNVINK